MSVLGRQMRFTKTVLPLSISILLAVPAAASAAFLHVVTPGESLSSVATTDGLTVPQLAAANGISPSTRLVTGSTLAIPPKTDALAVAPTATGASAMYGERGVLGSPAASSTEAARAASSGSYLVQRGDTLSVIAARAGLTVAELAAENGLNPSAYLRTGIVLRIGAGAPALVASSEKSGSARVTQPVGEAAEGSTLGPPYPTPERVSASEIGSIAAANGVPPSLADAIGWQESGFNNDLISSAGARGVMQILPGTWDWIDSTLTRTPLSPSSATDNVRAGVLMLRSLLSATGDSPSMTAAGYYQGLPSVERYGLFPDTQRYVNDVMALTSSFGGR